MKAESLVKLPTKKPPAGLGGKARKLNQLLRKNRRVPATWVIPQEAFQRYQQGDEHVLNQIRQEIKHHLPADGSYAVRSSANVEDGKTASFAGQFTTHLHLEGWEEIISGLRSVWEDTHTADKESYLESTGRGKDDIQMAVIIQEMVQPEVSGVSFSQNPITGRDEVVVEAVQGSGEKLVQGGVTPQRWVNKWGGWIEKPAHPFLPNQIIEKIVRETREIAAEDNHPIDLEWVYDGVDLYWVQLREITALDIPIYSNHISREVFPGLIKPLIWSINVPLVNGAWVDLFTEMIGPHDIKPESLARSFYYRAYFDMGTIGRIFELLGFPRESLELLMGSDLGGPDKPSFKPGPKTFSRLPRLLWFAAGKLAFGRRVKRYLPRAQAHFYNLAEDDYSTLSPEEILQRLEELSRRVRETAYFNIVTPLLMQLYHQVFSSRLQASGIDPQCLDLMAGEKRYAAYEPGAHLERLWKTYRSLSPEVKSRLEEHGYQALEDLDQGQMLKREINHFLEQFGHLSDSGNDFSAVPWRENPDVVLSMIIHYQPVKKKESLQNFQDISLPLLRRLLLTPLYRRARRFRLLREAVGSLYTFGYGLFRDAYLALGKHFKKEVLLQEEEDIFYLTRDEVKEMVCGDARRAQATRYQTLVSKRKKEIKAARAIQPPAVIYGEEEVEFPSDTPDELQGTAASRGRYTGPVRVVHGIADLHKVQTGDVLVVPYSDVGWTPLFNRAGAVVAESGGLLSHSSIIARESGIPAVVSVPGVCQLADDLQVTVDGYQGKVILHHDQP